LATRPGPKQTAVLLLFTAAAILVHGYHPYVEDAEIYVPGVKQALNPALYPYNPSFFASHAHLTLFPNLIAGSVHITHIPIGWALLLWQAFCIFLLLLACWRVGQLCFRDSRARWGGVALVASLLTLPVAGTALYIMDQYLNPRSFSAPALLFIVVNSIERKFWSAALWTVFTAAIHPLMVVFGLSYAILLLGMERSHGRPQTRIASGFLLLPFGLFPPVTGAYQQVLQSHAYFFVLRWKWYEWLGIFAPLALLLWFRRIARQQKLPVLDRLCCALVWFAFFFLVVALVLNIPPRFARFAELQPMRNLQLLYIVLLVFAGGLLAQFVLKGHLWRWLVLFAPLCAGMWFAQRELFPKTSHLEWPGREAKNDWVSAFLWIRANAPLDAYFALDPDYMALPGDDQHGFRAIAERSRLADRIKDSGAVTMFPALAETWHEQVQAQSGWKSFQTRDFQRLKEKFGVNWAVLERPGVTGLSCPYRNKTLLVCQIR
jgi:hypothetical protein